MKNRLNYRLKSILDIRRQFSNVVDPSRRQKLIKQAMKRRNVQLSALDNLLEFGRKKQIKKFVKMARKKGVDEDGIPYVKIPTGKGKRKFPKEKGWDAKGIKKYRKLTKATDFNYSAIRNHIIEFGHSAHFRRALKSLKRKVCLLYTSPSPRD